MQGENDLPPAPTASTTVLEQRRDLGYLYPLLPKEGTYRIGDAYPHMWFDPLVMHGHYLITRKSFACMAQFLGFGNLQYPARRFNRQTGKEVPGRVLLRARR